MAMALQTDAARRLARAVRGRLTPLLARRKSDVHCVSASRTSSVDEELESPILSAGQTSKVKVRYRELSRTDGALGYPRVNARYKPDTPEIPAIRESNLSSGDASKRHWQDEEWADAELRQAMCHHALLTWGPSEGAGDLPIIVRGKGPYLWDSDGKQYLDWTSQAVCANLGHDMPPAVQAAINKQMTAVPYLYGGLGTCEVRARLSALMAEIAPGNINGFLFPCGGGEANEAAIRIARRYTGKHKIITQYRSYHGGSTATLGATGDFRRWFAETGVSGFVKIFNPQPSQFSWGKSDESACRRALESLEETILMEGPNTIAAMLLESVVGAGGCLIPPDGYMQGVRALCDKYGILLIADEVMMGFFRTGPLFAFQHYEGVLPDIVTSAKGLTGAYLPMAMVGVRQPIKDYFERNAIGWGATYHAHPVSMACAYETVKHMLAEDFETKVAGLQNVMFEEVQRLADRHPSVKQGRVIGAFGCLDLVHPRTGMPMQRLNEPMRPELKLFRNALRQNGIIGLFRPPLFHCAPPLVITETELRDGFQRVSSALAQTLDKA
eukprot:TRINITY_DN1558_c0_g2_i6.p1 TRINITY_DN1558_c0_g2~~TRINITY_DN1558_c0_g2_i6.p1  ORF type:complete len:555 (+),score=79.59 TRINITY_DN1558_c0_g2_i6:63-1727(+)